MFRSAISFFIGVQLLIGSREASLAKFRARLWENPRRLTRFRRIEIQVGKLRSGWKARQRKILDESAWLRQLNAFPTTSTAEVVKGFSGSTRSRNEPPATAGGTDNGLCYNPN